MKIMTPRWIVLCLVAVALAAGGTALAEDSKSVGGVVCRAAYLSQQDDMAYLDNGGIRNENANLRYIECPLVNDQTGNDDGMAHLYVYARPEGSTMSCYAYSRGPTGGSADSDSGTSSGAGNVTFDFSVDSVDDSYYFVRCIVPYHGSIWGLKTVEWVGAP